MKFYSARSRRFCGVFLTAMAAWTSARAELSYSLDAPPLAPGESALLTLTVQNAMGVAGADLTIEVPEYVLPGTAETTPATADFLIASKPERGRIKVALARGHGLALEQATLLKIPVTVAMTAPAGLVPLLVSSSRFYSDQPAVLPHKVLPTLLTILPTATDRDGDGLPDDWEVRHFGGTQFPGTMDHDGDGFTAAEEFLLATDPLDPGSAFGVVRHEKLESPSGPVPMIQWRTRDGRRYAIEWSDGPLGPGMVWRRVYNPAFGREGSLASWHDDGSRTLADPSSIGERYYRVVVEDP